MGEKFLSNDASINRHFQPGLTLLEVTRGQMREFYLTCVPSKTVNGDAVAQGREVYSLLASWIRKQGAVGVQERVFGSLHAQEAILAQRQSLLGPELAASPWPASFIEGTPCWGQALAGVYLYAIAGPTCSQVYLDDRLIGISFEHDQVNHVYLTGIDSHRAGPTHRQEAERVFADAGRGLNSVNCSYSDVVRTWVYLADILKWYDEFNAVRSALYAGYGIGDSSALRPLPASTGIGGKPPHGAGCSMDLFALNGRGKEHIAIEQLYNPLQSEADSYGSAFSRGIAVAFDGLEMVYISGTASIDESGHSVHTNDFESQLTRTLDNISALLSSRNMSLADIGVSTVFVKDTKWADRARDILADRGAAAGDSVFVVADICRDDLLCEIDGIAVGPCRKS